jgi:hypothetical protein
VCRPSTNLPSLDHTALNAQQWVTPELGLNSMGNGFLGLAREIGKLCGSTTRIISQGHLTLTTYNLSFPICSSQPRKCAPSFLHSPLTSQLPFQGFNNRLDRNSLSTIVAVGLPLGNHFPNNLSHMERVSCRPDNLLLQSTSLTTCLFKPHAC